MNKQELASKIWTGANALRGKVSAVKYKDYILGFIFYKYLSEKQTRYFIDVLEYTEEDLKNLSSSNPNYSEEIKDIKEKLGYFIEYENLYNTWIDNLDDIDASSVQQGLKKFNESISPNYLRLYSDIFGALTGNDEGQGLSEINTDISKRSKNIRELLSLIADIPTDNKQEFDVLGFIYEFLLKNFAANAGKSGEFYTPYEASLVMSEIISNHLKGRKEISILDPTCGSGSLLINIGKSMARHLESQNKIKFYAQDDQRDAINLTKINLLTRDIEPANIKVRKGDTLAMDWPFFEDDNKDTTYELTTVDACCSNPPYSQTWNPFKDPRFDEYGLAPKGKADLAFLLHNLYHLDKDGIMTIVLPHGVLFRGGEEEDIRIKLVDKHNIDTIIGLPANMFFGTGIPTIIMVLKKQRKSSDILFVDASKGFIKDGNKNKLRAQDVRKIVDTVNNRISLPNYSRLVDYDEINENGYNLNISRYVVGKDEDEHYDIFGVMNGLIPNKEIDEMNSYWESYSSLKNELFKTENSNYSTLISCNVGKKIRENNDVISNKKAFLNEFDNFSNIFTERLVNNVLNVDINVEKDFLCNYVKEITLKNPLLNFYDFYEVIDNCFNLISQDIETIKRFGINVCKDIEQLYVLKKDKNDSNKLNKVPDKIEGKIFKFDFIQSIYFNELREKINANTSKLSELASQKENLLSSIDPNDKEQLVNDDGEIVAKKLTAQIKEIKNKVKNGFEVEEDSYEDVLLKIADIESEIKKIKEINKFDKTKIQTETEDKIKSLSSNEINELLSKAWIDSLKNKLIALYDVLTNRLEKQVLSLYKKYEISLKKYDEEISLAEKNIATTLKDLKCDEFDKKGIDDLIVLFEGEKNEH